MCEYCLNAGVGIVQSWYCVSFGLVVHMALIKISLFCAYVGTKLTEGDFLFHSL